MIGVQGTRKIGFREFMAALPLIAEDRGISVEEVGCHAAAATPTPPPPGAPGRACNIALYGPTGDTHRVLGASMCVATLRLSCFQILEHNGLRLDMLSIIMVPSWGWIGRHICAHDIAGCAGAVFDRQWRRAHSQRHHACTCSAPS